MGSCDGVVGGWTLNYEGVDGGNIFCQNLNFKSAHSSNQYICVICVLTDHHCEYTTLQLTKICLLNVYRKDIGRCADVVYFLNHEKSSY